MTPQEEIVRGLVNLTVLDAQINGYRQTLAKLDRIIAEVEDLKKQTQPACIHCGMTAGACACTSVEVLP